MLLRMIVLLAFASAGTLSAGAMEFAETTWQEQAWRFLSLRDPAVKAALFGSALLGVCCGLLGCFLVARRLSLVGDALSHAVLPGVALGFLWAGTKDPVAIFIGASIAGLAGALLVNLVRATTHLKEDSALGMVLAGFYGVGIVLVTMIQGMPLGNQSGIDKFLFGQAAALSTGDLQLIAAVTAVALLAIVLFYKELMGLSFDRGFLRSLGLPAGLLDAGLMLLLAFAIVVSLQAVGVVLVSALLITPAAAAYLLTDRFHRMLALACLFGLGAGALGAFLSFLGPNLPTGPFMVVAASAIFLGALLFAPRHGLLPRRWRRLSRDRRIRLENTLKAVFQSREAEGFANEGVTLAALAERRREPLEEMRKQVNDLVRLGLGSVDPLTDQLLLTPEGWLKACAVIRNHRLWELYLTRAADYPADHVHDDADEIEHVLGEETVRKLERRLDFPSRDPHGKLIPSLSDLQRRLIPAEDQSRSAGYRAPQP
jgi:ABC-type Mn2+/Zn2+ transport system permease subunit/Mn-dependent DtxR family transcriptional regulator